MSRRKRQPEQFDVVEFLRESDGDLKSALNSLLRNPVAQPDAEDNTAPGIKLTLGDVLVRHGNTTGPTKALPGPELIPGLDLARVDSSEERQAEPAPNLRPDQDLNLPLAYSEPGLNLRPGKNGSDSPATTTASIPLKTTAVPSGKPKKRHFPVREMKLAQDAHTRAEQQVYEYLWQNAKTLDEVSRTLTIGFGAMARMVRLSESNARINVRSLIAKLAIEEFADYNCERSLGRTYRIFNYSEVLKRRREAGLLWYMRRTLAVVFVNPTTGQPLDLGLRKARQTNTGPGPNLTQGDGLNLRPAPLLNLGAEPGLNLDPLNREEDRDNNIREISSSSDARLFEALSQYGLADDEVIKRLRAQTRNVCADFTDEELVHFIHSKGHLIRRRDSGISNPIGFLLTSVPKCFVGEAFQLFRKAQKEARDREAAERAERQAELESWRREQQAILDDPNASEDDKRWARKILSPGKTN